MIELMLDRLNKRLNEETEDEEEMTCETLKEKIRRIRSLILNGINDFEADKAALRHPFFPILNTDEHGKNHCETLLVEDPVRSSNSFPNFKIKYN